MKLKRPDAAIERIRARKANIDEAALLIWTILLEADTMRLTEWMTDYVRRSACWEEGAMRPACGTCFHCTARALLKELP